MARTVSICRLLNRFEYRCRLLFEAQRKQDIPRMQDARHVLEQTKETIALMVNDGIVVEQQLLTERVMHAQWQHLALSHVEDKR